MADTTNGLASPVLDMGYVRLNDRVSSEERDVAVIARSNGNDLLEPYDFDETNPWRHKDTPSEKEFLNNPELKLEKYKRQVVTAMLRREGEALQDIWPDLYLEELARVIIANASGITNINDLVLKLVPVLEKNTSYTTEEMLVFTIAWVNMYRLGILHEAWVAQGHTPILPDEEGEAPGSRLARFVSESLKRLESGEVGVFKMPEGSEALHVAAYDGKTDNLLMPAGLYEDPLAGQASGIDIFSVVVHEMYHAEQDAQKLQIPLMEAEAQAEILDAKAAYLLFGNESLSRESERLEQELTQYHFIKRALSGVRSPLLIIVDEYLDKESVQAQHLFYRVSRNEVALRELDEGKIDYEGREKFTELYTRRRFFEIFQSVVIQLENTEAYDVDIIESREFKKEIRKKIRQYKWPQRFRYDFEYKPVEGRPPYEHLIEEISDVALRFFLIYYRRGEKAARRYFKEEVEPAFYNGIVPAIRENVFTEFDGIGQ